MSNVQLRTPTMFGGETLKLKISPNIFPLGYVSPGQDASSTSDFFGVQNITQSIRGPDRKPDTGALAGKLTSREKEGLEKGRFSSYCPANTYCQEIRPGVFEIQGDVGKAQMEYNKFTEK